MFVIKCEYLVVLRLRLKPGDRDKHSYCTPLLDEYYSCSSNREENSYDFFIKRLLSNSETKLRWVEASFGLTHELRHVFLTMETQIMFTLSIVLVTYSYVVIFSVFSKRERRRIGRNMLSRLWGRITSRRDSMLRVRTLKANIALPIVFLPIY